MYTIHLPNIKNESNGVMQKSAIPQMFYLDIIKILQIYFFLIFLQRM